VLLLYFFIFEHFSINYVYNVINIWVFLQHTKTNFYNHILPQIVSKYEFLPLHKKIIKTSKMIRRHTNTRRRL